MLGSGPLFGDIPRLGPGDVEFTLKGEYVKNVSRPLAALTAACAALLLLAAASVPAATPGGKLSKEERAALAKARAEGKDTVVLLIATQPGQARAVANGLETLGAKVGYEDAQLGYVRATVPLDKVEQAFGLPGIAAADIDELIPLPDPRPEAGGFNVANTAPGASTPRSNPYMPIRDTGAASFLDAHPTWDGRA